MLEGANSSGIHATLAAEGYAGGAGHTTPELLEAVLTGNVRALLVFGADPVAAFPGSLAARAMRAASLSVVTAALPGPAVESAHVVLPSAVFGEKSGTIRGAFGTPADLSPVMAPPGQARQDLAILDALAARMASPATSPPTSARNSGGSARTFFDELDLFLRSEGREAAAREPGTHLLRRGIVGDQRRRRLAHGSALMGALRLSGASARDLAGTRSVARRARQAIVSASAATGDTRSCRCGSTTAFRKAW